MDVKIIERITKLMALAKDGGATEAEAELAMNKAHELATANNLSIAEIEASGGKSEGRTKEEEQGQAMYGYQRNLMTVLCEVNYCYCSIIYKAAKSKSMFRHRTVPAGYRIIGRESNVATVKVMFDYLMKTINRLVLAELVARDGDYRQRMSRWAMSWCDGCSDRLVQRINHRHLEMLRKQKEEAEAKNAYAKSHPSSGTALAVILVDHAANEEDLNNDFRHGWEPGTTARNKAKEKAEQKRRYDEAIAAGADKEVAWYMSFGYSRENAEKIVHPENFETEADRLKRQQREKKQDERWQRQYRRQDRKRNWEGYEAGSDAGNSIGLDTQVDHSSTNARRIK